MIPVPEAMAYIRQLAGLRRMPREEPALKALAERLGRHAEDGTHAGRIVEAILEDNTDWPGPKALREAAERTTDYAIRQREAAAASRRRDESQMAKWKGEFYEDVLPGLCKHCNGFGLLFTSDGKVVACSCPEGRPKWVDQQTGRPCPPDWQGAVHYNSPEWIARWNGALAKKGDKNLAKAMSADSEAPKKPSVAEMEEKLKAHG